MAIGFILSLLGLAYARILDDSVYVPSDFEKRYPYPVLGVTFAGEEESGDVLLQEHVELVSRGMENVWYADTGERDLRIPEEARGSGRGLILRIPYGSGNGRLLERWVKEAGLVDCRILGAVITGADMGLYRLYFTGKKRKTS